nr:hypothetical protein [uncultured Acetatifactor sp.]
MKWKRRLEKGLEVQAFFRLEGLCMEWSYGIASLPGLERIWEKNIENNKGDEDIHRLPYVRQVKILSGIP